MSFEHHLDTSMGFVEALPTKERVGPLHHRNERLLRLREAVVLAAVDAIPWRGASFRSLEGP